MSLGARTLTPLGVFGLYVAGHVFLRGKTLHLKHGYIDQNDPRLSEAVLIDPNFKFEAPTS